MSKIKALLGKFKSVKALLALVLVIVIIGGGLVFFFTIRSNQATVAGYEAQISSLTTQLDELGELVPAYTLACDVPSGKEISEADLVEISVPLSMADSLVGSIDEVEGYFYKVSKTEGAILSLDDVYEEVVTADMRYLDVNLDQIPIGLQVGTYVDIRLKFGSGADFVVLSHARVQDIWRADNAAGGTLKLIVTEEGLHLYNCAFVESIVCNSGIPLTDSQSELYKDLSSWKCGAVLYAIEYVEGAIQDSAASYYAPSDLVRAVLENDPNVKSLSSSSSDLTARSVAVTQALRLPSTVPAAVIRNIMVSQDIQSVVNDRISKAQGVYIARMEALAEAEGEE